jgi:hypothetical protein
VKRRKEEAYAAAEKKGKAEKSTPAKGSSHKSASPRKDSNIRYNSKNVPKTAPIENVQEEVSQIMMVGKGASPSDLKSVVEMIPKNIICELYDCSFSKFERQINEKLESSQDYSSTAKILRKVLKRFLIWMNTVKQPADTSKKRHAKEETLEEPIPRKKTKMNNPTYPTLLVVPNDPLVKYFGNTSFQKDNQSCFRIKNVLGDGNCLYRSLSQSKLFKSRYPSLASNHIEVRKKMQEFAIANGNLSRLMFRFSWKNDPDGKEFEKRYESWIDSLVEADK